MAVAATRQFNRLVDDASDPRVLIQDAIHAQVAATPDRVAAEFLALNDRLAQYAAAANNADFGALMERYAAEADKPEATVSKLEAAEQSSELQLEDERAAAAAKEKDDLKRRIAERRARAAGGSPAKAQATVDVPPADHAAVPAARATLSRAQESSNALDAAHAQAAAKEKEDLKRRIAERRARKGA